MELRRDYVAPLNSATKNEKPALMNCSRTVLNFNKYYVLKCLKVAREEAAEVHSFAMPP